LSPFRDFGAIDGPIFAKRAFGCAGRSRKRLAAELTNVLISIRRRRAGAERESSKPSIDDFGFCRCQFASTAANQYSVLVIHFFSFSSIESVERARALQEKPSRRKRLLIGAAALAVEGISVESAGCRQGACGQRPEPTGYHLDFLLVQITSSLADQHSVLIIHVFVLSSFWVR
jgi:hypothetical protein